MSKIGLVIVDGVGFRNFILSDFLTKMRNGNNEIIILSGLKKEVYKNYFLESKVIELEIYREKKSSWIYRKAKELAHLQNNRKVFSIANTLKSQKLKRISGRSIITNILIKFTTKFHSEKWINRFYRGQVTSFKNSTITEEYRKLLKDENPDVLFFTHQRPPYLAPLDYAAKKVGIKTCSFIFSWDNLPSKGRMAAPFDSFLVWSDLMKEELHHYYPETKKQPVQVVGTPQFEPYVLERYKSSEEDFRRNFKLDPAFKTICYSCGDASTSKNDPVYIKIIAGLVAQNKLTEKVNFLVRTSPAEDGSRFKTLVEEFPFIKWNYPQWKLTRENHPEPWSQRVPLAEDLVGLRSLLEYCDLNINMCSTMSLDFMLFDKPVINPVFGNEQNGLYNDQRFLRYAHYEKVVESGAVAIVKNEEELLREVNFSLENPNARLKEQRELIKLQIGKPLEGTSERIVAALKTISEA